MEIRFLTADDAGEWLRLRLEALEGDPDAFSASTEEYRSLSLDEVRKRLGLDREDSFVVGAFDDGHLQGVAGFYREKGLKSRHKGQVWGVYVTPRLRGQGISRRIMEMVLGRGARINGIEQIMISVTATQAAALGLYRSLGFESFGREPRALKIGDWFIDEEYMVLRLRSGNRDENER